MKCIRCENDRILNRLLLCSDCEAIRVEMINATARVLQGKKS